MNTWCKDVVVVDQVAMFRAEQRRCDREFDKLNSLRSELENHERRDLPAFTTWFYSNFAEELAQLRELQDELARMYDTLDRVKDEVETRGTSFQRAYERAARKPSTSKPSTPKRDHFDESESDESDGGGNHHGTGHDHDHDTEAGCGHQRGPEFQRSSRAEAMRANPLPPEASQDIKDRYRELVRQLHPDLNPKQSDHHRDLWHEVQEAYQKRDLQRLEQLVARAASGGRKNAPRSSTLAELRERFRELRSSVTEIRKLLHRMRREPAWAFCETRKEPRKLQSLETRMALEIQDDLESLQVNVTELEELFESWKRPVRPTRAENSGHSRKRGRGRSSR